MSNSIFNWPSSPKRFVRFTSAKAEDVNDALDDLSTGLDTVEANLARAIKLPVGTADQTLNLAAGQRAGLLLGFDEAGNIAGVAGGGRWRGDWAAATLYAISDCFRDPVSKNIYACVEQHTATSIAADLVAQKVRLAIDVAEVENQRILAQQAAAAADQSYTLSSQNSSAAAASAATAATNASSASASAATASTKAAEASSSATAAAGSASTASTKASEASSSAASAASSAGVATTKAAGASSDAATATTKAGEAASSASAAASSASAANTKAGEASASAASAAGSASVATTKASEASASAIAASKLNLGDKAVEPTVDNQGGALRAGATYYNTTTNKWRVWTGTAWGDGVSVAGNLVSRSGDTMLGPLVLVDQTLPINTNNLPTIRPTLLLDFANSRSVDPRITFTRASTATRVNERGLIEVVAAGVPRIDFDPVTLACRGLLIEEARTNRCPSSADIGFGSWGNAQNIQVLGRSIAPDGTNTATVLGYLNSVGAFSVIYMPVSAGETVTASTYIRLKAGTLQSGIGASMIVDDALGVRKALYMGAEGTPALDGTWRRHSITVTNGNTSGTLILYVAVDFAPGVEIEVWGAQIEAGTFPTSYIPTTTAQVTRAADVASMTGTNFTSWYRQDEGTFVADAQVATTNNYSGTYRHVLQALQTSSTASRVNLLVSSANQMQSEVAVSSAIGSSLLQGTNTGSVFKVATAYKTNDFAFSANGTAPTTDTSGSVPSDLSKMLIGGVYGGAANGQLNGHVLRIAYYPKRLSNAELQALTTP